MDNIPLKKVNQTPGKKADRPKTAGSRGYLK